MTTSPYTHPSMPGTAALVLDLSAALEDAEGQALVEDIIDRKRTRNLREKMLQLAIWGQYQTDGHGNVIPRQEPDFWAYLAGAFRAGEKLTLTKRMNAPTTVQAGFDGPVHTIAWYDELAAHWRSRLLVGGRGHGKVRAQIEALRTWNSRPEVFTAHKAPGIGEVRWSCRRPTDPVWPVGQAALMQYPPMPDDNRKLNAQMAVKVTAIHDILGVPPHGSND